MSVRVEQARSVAVKEEQESRQGQAELAEGSRAAEFGSVSDPL